MKIFIGRMQPPHNGHIATIEQAKDDDLLILLGSCNMLSEKNPFSFEERKEMLELHPSIINRRHKTIIKPLRDYPNDDDWIAQVNGIVSDYTRNPIMLCPRKDSSSYYLDLFPSYKKEEVEIKYPLHSTHLRDLYNKDSWDEMCLHTHFSIVEYLKNRKTNVYV